MRPRPSKQPPMADSCRVNTRQAEHPHRPRSHVQLETGVSIATLWAPRSLPFLRGPSHSVFKPVQGGCYGTLGRSSQELGSHVPLHCCLDVFHEEEPLGFETKRVLRKKAKAHGKGRGTVGKNRNCTGETLGSPLALFWDQLKRCWVTLSTSYHEDARLCPGDCRCD